MRANFIVEMERMKKVNEQALGTKVFITGIIHVNPERSFGGTNGEPPSEASQLRKGGENFKNLHGKWCNLRYS